MAGGSFLPHPHAGIQFSLSCLDPALRLQLEPHQLLILSSWLAPHPTISLGWWALVFQPTRPCPRPGTRQLGTASLPYSILTWFKLANPKPAYPASPVLSHRNHNKGPCPHFPLMPSASPPQSPDSHVASRGAGPLLWGPVSIINSLFKGSHLLICWPYH